MTKRTSVTATDEDFRRIIFSLEKDEDGYPPNDYETLWARIKQKGLYEIDNIPFFVRGVSPGDLVTARDKDGLLYFDGISKESLNSVLRVIAYDESIIPKLREELLEMGCESELSHVPNLIAVQVPANINLNDVLQFLDVGESNGEWEYETGALRA